jgi:hypothetical protein
MGVGDGELHRLFLRLVGVQQRLDALPAFGFGKGHWSGILSRIRLGFDEIGFYTGDRSR